MTTIDRRRRMRSGTTKLCPHCHGDNLRWFGILRICAACGITFHWRDALIDS